MTIEQLVRAVRELYTARQLWWSSFTTGLTGPRKRPRIIRREDTDQRARMTDLTNEIQQQLRAGIIGEDSSRDAESYVALIREYIGELRRYLRTKDSHDLATLRRLEEVVKARTATFEA